MRRDRDLEREIKFFKMIQDELADKYPGKFVLIHNEAVDSIRDTNNQAYNAAEGRFARGEYTIEFCVPRKKDT